MQLNYYHRSKKIRGEKEIMNVTREEAIIYLTELKDNPIKLINEIDSELEAVTLDLVLSMAINALEQSPKPN